MDETDIVTIRMEDELHEVVETMNEEGYFGSISEGVRYCMDREYEGLDGWDATTEQSDKVDRRLAELGGETNLELEYTVSEEFMEDSRKLAEKVLEQGEGAEASANRYLEKYFE